MIPDPYGPRVRELFTDPAHAGQVEGGESVLVDDQGVRVQLSARVDKGVVQSLRFRAWGCPHTIAAAEAACRALEGQAVAAFLEFSASDLMEELAVPVEKTGRILVLEDAVRSLGPLLDD